AALAVALGSVVVGSMLAARTSAQPERASSSTSEAAEATGVAGVSWVRGAGWGALSAIALGVSFYGLDVLTARGLPIVLVVASYRLITALGLGAASAARRGARQVTLARRGGERRAVSLARWTGLGILDAGGMLVYAWGCARGEVAVVAVVASLFPALTVSLAQWRMGERLSGWQWVGLVWMLVGLCVVAALQAN
ncbi:MAG: EamA family transporter, partial [Nannocystaceae bacterium]